MDLQLAVVVALNFSKKEFLMAHELLTCASGIALTENTGQVALRSWLSMDST
jgi:hypothetical protein